MMEDGGTITSEMTAFQEGVRELYREGQTDYSLEPLVAVDHQGKPIGLIRDGDAVVFCCRRGEREIQLTEAFVEPNFNAFPRKSFHDLIFVPLTLYHEKFRNLAVAFPPITLKDTLAEVVSNHGLRQLHIAESEKFAHVTFFLNGGKNQPFPGEEDINVPSLRGVSLDQVPELNASGVREAAFRGIEKGYDLIVANFANGDVIGHVTNREAKTNCAQAVDKNLGLLVQAAITANYAVMITADHGILEEMVKTDGTATIGHTTNRVPLILVNQDPSLKSKMMLRRGKLADVAPSVLEVLGLPKPEAMTGHSLLASGFRENPQRVVLIILDGWGLGKDDATNPIFSADTPTWDMLRRDYPFTRLEASGEAVGLGSGKQGNSEAGHMNLGAGRVVPQDDVRLELAMKDGSFYTNEVFLRTMDVVKQRKSTLHLLALLSEMSSHGTMKYPLALLRLAKEKGLKAVNVHIIFDGRGTEPGSAPLLLETFAKEMETIGIGKIVSGVGRSFALDRDGDYAKTRVAYDAFVFGKGKPCPMKI
jgi:2,3-bisphosphoglycerate-independent phosphoglycerate mutase